MSNLRRKKFNPVTFGEPWNSFLGSRELKGVWTIYGPSGHGKTSMAIQLANYLCQFGKVMYDSIEQGASESLIEAFRREGSSTRTADASWRSSQTLRYSKRNSRCRARRIQISGWGKSTRRRSS